MNDNGVFFVDLIEFIETVLIKNIGSIVYGPEDCRDCQKNIQHHYLSFVLITHGIEVLGACMDELPFDKKNESEKRFKKAMRKIFAKINKKYLKYINPTKEHYLYEGLRCGLSHMLRPQKNIRLTSRHEASEDGNSHLKKDNDDELIIVAEDLYDDFKKACEKIIRQLKDGTLTNKKLKEHYISIKKYKN